MRALKKRGGLGSYVFTVVLFDVGRDADPVGHREVATVEERVVLDDVVADAAVVDGDWCDIFAWGRVGGGVMELGYGAHQALHVVWLGLVYVFEFMFVFVFMFVFDIIGDDRSVGGMWSEAIRKSHILTEEVGEHSQPQPAQGRAKQGESCGGGHGASGILTPVGRVHHPNSAAGIQDKHASLGRGVR